MKLIEACDKAAEIISQSSHLDKLYRQAVKSQGAGELRSGILNMVADAIDDETLREEVFLSDDNMLGFLCGVWIQYLLTEVAGIKKDKLQALAQKILHDIKRDKSLH
jgi:hypothetical protein